MPDDDDRNGHRVDTILQEIRIVLPGTQALLGFQFVAFFNSAFYRLTPGLQQYHLVNLLLTTVCTILLISPVAFQEIGDGGHNTKRWLRFTSHIIPVAMFCLLASMAGDILVDGRMLSIDNRTSAVAAALVFIFGMGMWFGFSLVMRRRLRQS